MTSIDKSRIEQRHSKLRDVLSQSEVDALVLNPGPSLFYLTGLRFHLSERPIILIFPGSGPLVIVLPELEAGKTFTLDFPVKVSAYGEDPESWHSAFQQAAQLAEIDAARLGVEERRLRYLELEYLKRAAPKASFHSAEQILSSLRIQKDASEIAAMRKAVEIAQIALRTTLTQFKTGMTEKELANELTIQLLHYGSEPELPFYPIVASGPNSANPHMTPTDREIAPGDALILDWGASVDGYASDLTRTFSAGKPDPELERIAKIVMEANEAARRKAGPGVQASEVDQAARQVIETAGYGKYFIHRTGHGLGLEGHEEPYIRGDNPRTLMEGMTFTIEPGIYIQGKAGVRIEDNIVVTPDGAESLSDLPRELSTIG